MNQEKLMLKHCIYININGYLHLESILIVTGPSLRI